MLLLQALFVLDDMVSNRVGLSVTNYIDDRPIIKYPLSNKYKKRALNMLAENMFIHRVVIGTGINFIKSYCLINIISIAIIKKSFYFFE
jgi:hypothetical protein